MQPALSFPHCRRLFSPDKVSCLFLSAGMASQGALEQAPQRWKQAGVEDVVLFQPRRAWPTPSLRLEKSKRLCAPELMLTSTPSSLAIWHWLSGRSRRSGWALSSRRQPRSLAWQMMRSLRIGAILS
jgi:hypothetical protein